MGAESSKHAASSTNSCSGDYIVAETCRHPVPTGPRKKVQYCNDCETYLAIKTRWITAQRALEEQRAADPFAYKPYRAARLECDEARVLFYQFRDTAPEREAPRCQLVGLSTTASPKLPSTKTKSVRFDAMQEHQDEEEYRARPDYCRTSKDYAPGRHANTTGTGHADISNPDGIAAEARRQPRPAKLRERFNAPNPGAVDAEQVLRAYEREYFEALGIEAPNLEESLFLTTIETTPRLARRCALSLKGSR